MRHLKALLSIARRKLQPHQVTAFVHAITDGRDTAPCSATQFLVDDLGQFLAMENFAALGTVCGRYYAMDRDQRQERTDMVYDALTEGKGQPVRPCDLAQVRCTKIANSSLIPRTIAHQSLLTRLRTSHPSH